jgi:hypothetical protein
MRASRRGGVWPGAVVLLVGTALGFWLYVRYAPPPPSQYRAATDGAIEAANRVFPAPSTTVPEAPSEARSEPAANPSASAAADTVPTVVPSSESGLTAPSRQEAATAPPPSIAPTGFNVVVGSFRDEWRATALSERISRLGLPVRVRSVPGWTQVVVGEYGTLAEAEVARERLLEVDVIAAVIAPSVRPTESTFSPVPVATASRPAVASTNGATAATGQASLFDRARSLAQKGEVRGLFRLRESAEGRLQREGWARDDIVRMLRELDPLFDQARRRRLALDAEAAAER